MPQFIDIEYKNLNSVGNHPIKIDLTKSQNTLIGGRNGAGKCVDGKTEIEIRIPNSSILLKTTIHDLFVFYKGLDNLQKNIEVKTRYGFFRIQHCDITAINSEVIHIVTKNGYFLKCSPEHKVFSTSYQWESVKNVFEGESILTEIGFDEIIHKELMPYKDDLYDIQVAEVREYYSNGIVSHNSTMLYSFAYGLFGKFPSGAKLADAINSVNKKNLLVKIRFRERGDDYLVIRGEKPKKFEIYKNDEMLDQNANARDQQKILELILGMDYKTFTQIVLLNKEKYVPFMQMTTAERRKIVEDILGISVFSYMNDVCKHHIKENQREANTIEREIDVNRTRMEGQQRLVREIQETIASKNKDNKTLLKNKQDQLQHHQDSIVSIEKEMDDIILDGHEQVKKEIREYEKLSVQFEQKIKTARNNSKFFQNNDHCPSCGQNITEELKQKKQHECDTEVNEIQSIIQEMMGELESSIEKDTSFKERESKYNDLKTKLDQQKYAVRSLNKDIEAIVKASETSSDNERLDSAIGEYNDFEKAVSEARESLEAILKQGEQLERLRVILKDDGVKAVIIREYMNLINKKINEYLQSMNFFINMTLDENFNESFGAIHKENFTMNNLSTGQKTRVNIAIWLALLEIASIKNSVVSNVILIDEILESLDSEGVKDVMALFKEKLSDKNIFVITQRFDEFKDLFRSQIQFKLNNGFTEMVNNGE